MTFFANDVFLTGPKISHYRGFTVQSYFLFQNGFYSNFRAIGCEVLAASTDSACCHRAWINTPCTDGGLGEINIPILADPTHAISKVVFDHEHSSES